ncbi:MAG: acyl-CoA dehydrogenase family protein [Gammaproteobacteria bacterium]
MRLVASEEESYLRDTARNFFDEKMPISHLREIRDTKNLLGYKPEYWQQMAELGWAGIIVPDNLGGAGFDLAALGVIAEEAGRNLSPSPLISTAAIGASMLTAAARADDLQKLCQGKLLTALALDEQGWHDPTQINCRAKPTAQGFTLTGTKRFVADGIGAHLYLIVARTAEISKDLTEGLSIFAVPADTDGLEVMQLSAADSRNTADLKLDITLTTDHLLGELNKGYDLLQPALDIGRSCLAAEMLGGCQYIFEQTLEYLRQRKQFGSAIGSFQALQHRAANLYCQIEIARSSVIAALASHRDKPDDFARLASLAKAQAGLAFHQTSKEAIQMHGGIGVTDELDLGFYLKRARIAEQMLGDYLWHNRRYATLSGF